MAGQQQLRRGEYEQGNAGGLAGQEDVTDVYETTVPTGDGGVKQNRVEVRRHGREEKAAELGGVAAGAYGLYEKHQGKKDPENATRHKIEEMVGGVGAVGAGGFAYHEHGEKKDGKKEGKDLKKEGKHGLFK